MQGIFIEIELLEQFGGEENQLIELGVELPY